MYVVAGAFPKTWRYPQRPEVGPIYVTYSSACQKKTEATSNACRKFGDVARERTACSQLLTYHNIAVSDGGRGRNILERRYIGLNTVLYKMASVVFGNTKYLNYV